MKKSCFTLFMIVAFSQIIQSQIIESFKGKSPERIYLQSNASVLLTGEYLFFSMYCVQANDARPSNFSKVAYVDLINENKQVVLESKIILSRGSGQGDFFLPTTLKSGSYKLTAYTNWMQNNSKTIFSEEDIVIINPYLGEQPNVVNNKHTNQKIITFQKNDNSGVSINTNKKFYSKREQVLLEITPNLASFKQAKIVVSVRRLDELDQLLPINFSTKTFKINTKNERLKEKLVFYPEHRGLILQGTLVNKNNKKVKSFRDISIAVPGKNSFFKLLKTNFEGDFLVGFDSYFDGNPALIQVLREDKEEVNDSIVIHKKSKPDYSNLSFVDFSITPNLKQLLIDRSIYNQIESNYFSVKPDSIITPVAREPFYCKEKSIVIKLDDYKRFSTLKETFVEVVDPVFVKREGGVITFNIRRKDDYLYEHLKPLILLDDVIIQNYQWLLDFNAYRVDNIRIVRHNVILGAKTYKGIIAIETEKKDVDFVRELPEIFPYEIDKPLLPKKYFQQVYDETNEENYKRVPDYRLQLLWKPKMYLSGEKINLPFYTSDVAGTYKISVEGFTNDGRPISSVLYFEVK